MANAKREFPRRRPVKRRRTRPFPTRGEDARRLEKTRHSLSASDSDRTRVVTVPASVLQVSGFFQRLPRVTWKVRIPISCTLRTVVFFFKRSFQLPRIRRKWRTNRRRETSVSNILIFFLISPRYPFFSSLTTL